MNSPRRRFAVALAAFVLIFLAYGLRRLGLGVDFTDEGAYAAWPLRTLFGEPPFAGDPLLLSRPIFNDLAALYRLYPDISLYELRLLGWIVHLSAFAALAACLFRLTGAVWRSLLIGSVPFFLCHIFGLATPSYNSLSSDFLLIGFSLLSLASGENARHPFALQSAAGLALFVATLAHPALGLVAILFGANEILGRRLIKNLLRLRPTPSNTGFLVFAGCCLAYFFRQLATGSFAVWLERRGQYRAGRITALEGGAPRFFGELFAYPFAYDRLALGFSAAAFVAVIVLTARSRAGRAAAAAQAAGLLAFVLVAAIVGAFAFDAGHLPAAFAMVSAVVIAVHLFRLGAPFVPTDFDTRRLLVASALGAVLYATTTYYFNPLRSWTSGILALPFAFSAGLALLLATSPRPAAALRVLVSLALALAVVCVARDHYGFIERDAAPAQLSARFHVPKLRFISSTPERVRAVDGLYAYLHPRLVRGEPLLAFDNCPLLYFLLDAKPAYGLTWAVRYSQSPATLRQLDRELNSRPLPRYAIRTLVNLANPVWSAAPPTNYDNYPLNATLRTRYVLERKIFPFEIWRLAPAPSRP